MDGSPVAALDLPLTVTFFPSFGAAQKREERLSLRDLMPRILQATSKSKSKLPWLKLAKFGEIRTGKNSLRHNDNVLSVSGIEGDYDTAITTVSEAVAVLRGASICGMVYTSPSHTEDTPKWRVLCPLSKDHPPATRDQFIARLNGLFHGSLAGESFTLSQSYYFGSVNANPSHCVELVAGDYLDLREDLEECAIGKPQSMPSPKASPKKREPNANKYIDGVVRNALDRVRTAPDGEKHRTLLKQARTIGGYQTQGGFTTAEAVQWLIDALPQSAKDKKAAAVTAEWGLARGREAPLSVPPMEDRSPPQYHESVPPPEDDGPTIEPDGNVVRIRRSNPNDDWKAAWHRGDSGAPLPTLFNVMIALRRFPPFCSLVRYDDMQLTCILAKQIPGHKDDPRVPRPIRDKDIIAIQETLQGLGLRRVGKNTAQDGVDLLAHENSFHPIRQYLDGLVWDGIQRCLGWLGRYLGVDGSPYSDMIGQLFMVALVARIYQPGCQADYVLVLEGPQGALKSSACRALAGQWFSDSLPDLTHADPVRLSMHLRGKWLIEIAELASFNASETEIIKAFATRTHETYTPKYGHHEVTEPRQCLLIASTNQSTYLHDETGARRFWPVRVGHISLEDLKADRDQLFAEAVSLYQAGERWWPEREFEAKYIAPQQAERYEEDAWEGAISQWLSRELGEKFTISSIAHGALSMEVQRIGTREQRRIRKVLVQLGWTQSPGRAMGRTWKRPKEDAQQDTP